MKDDSAVEFSGNSRVHIGLVVSDLARSVQFYRVLLGVGPSKERPGYAKFEPHDPPVNLSLNQAAEAPPPRRAAAHYGIQVKRSVQVTEAAARLRRHGHETVLEREATCCYAVQDKVWVADPDGNRWEVFVVLDNDPHAPENEPAACCSGEQTALCC